MMRNMELLGRVCAALGISLVLTLLLLVLYQDDAQQATVGDDDPGHRRGSRTTR